MTEAWLAQALTSLNLYNCPSPTLKAVPCPLLLIVSPPSFPRSRSSVHQRPPGQNSDGSEFSRSGLQQSNAWPGGFIDPSANNQVNATQDTIDITPNCYPSPSPQPQPVQGGIPGMDGNNIPYQPSCFSHLVPQHVGSMSQSTSHQQHYIHHPGDVRHSFMQPHAPTPQPAGYLFLPSPPRTSSSHSHSGTGLGQPDQPSSRRVSFQSNCSTPPIPQHHSDPNLQPQNYSPYSPQSNGPYHPYNLSSYGQQPSYPGMPPHNQRFAPYPRNDGPSFSESQPLARGKRKRSQGSPDIQSSRGKRKPVSRSGQRPLASSSRVTLDTPLPQDPPSRKTSPQPARKKARRLGQTEVSYHHPSCSGVPFTNWHQKAQKKDADRKSNDRKERRKWLDKVLKELAKPIAAHELKILDASEHHVRFALTNAVLTWKS